MKRLLQKSIIAVSAVSFLIIGCSVEPTGPVDTKSKYTVSQGYDNKYIIIYSLSKENSIQGPDNSNSLAKEILLSNGISDEVILDIYSSVVKGFCAKLTRDEVELLVNDPRIRYIEPDQLVQLPDEKVNSEINNKQAKTLTQTTGWGVQATGSANYSGNNKAWIVDTGIDLDHPDLNVSSTLNRTFVRSGQDSRNADDRHGHGTHCAGIVAAKNNSTGYLGVAANATVVAVKVLNQSGSGTISQIVSGLNYVGQYDAQGDVVNLSLGGGISTTLDNAVSNLASTGTWVVVAAGNSGANSANYSPARVNGNYVRTISAHDSNNNFASWSNYGTPVDWCAPGVNIPSLYKNGGYATMSGTSMATPHVAGILLSTGGTINSRGTVSGDPDGNPDPLAGR